MSSFSMKVTAPNGVDGFIEPLVTVTKGNKVTLINTLKAGGSMARDMAYIAMACGSKDKDGLNDVKAYQDITKREAGSACLKTLNSESLKGSIFTFYHPASYSDLHNMDVAKWTPIVKVSSDDMLSTAIALDVSNKAILSVQAIIAEAVNKTTFASVKTVNEFPIYCESAKVAKTRGGKVGKEYGDIFS